MSNLEALQNAYGQMAEHYDKAIKDRHRWRQLAVELAVVSDRYLDGFAEDKELEAAIAAVRAAGGT